MENLLTAQQQPKGEGLDLGYIWSQAVHLNYNHALQVCGGGLPYLRYHQFTVFLEFAIVAGEN